MNEKEELKRPPFQKILTGKEFNRWHWLKEKLVEICKKAGLPSNGSKFELRDRIMYALDNHRALTPTQKKKESSIFIQLG